MNIRCLDAPTTQPIRILQLSDPHLLEDKHKTFAGILPFLSLQKVLEHVQQHLPVDCILTTGDIAQEPTTTTYQYYFDEIAKLNLPHFWVRGNHDDNDSFPEQNEQDEPEVILIDRWCIILLDSEVIDKVYGEISDDHLDKLHDILQSHQDYHVLIALHHHTFAVNCAWLDAHKLKNSDAFLECISSYLNVRLVLCGHIHQIFEKQYQHILFLSCPSTCIQFKPQSDEFCLDHLPPGYRILELYADGQVKTEVHRLAENVGDVDYQLCGY